jgi:malonate-semialdehyde dehydrogenase (acetylating)/methylmalonate-semialdehyde dehydrogenase
VPGTDIGPVISKESKQRIHKIIAESEKQGAKILLDGRKCDVKGYEKGNFVGPTILSEVKVKMIVI